jgi:hypothetical protein
VIELTGLPTSTSIYGSLNSGYLTGANPATSWQVIGTAGTYRVGNAVIAAAWTNIRYGNIQRFHGASARFNDAEINGVWCQRIRLVGLQLSEGECRFRGYRRPDIPSGFGDCGLRAVKED